MVQHSVITMQSITAVHPQPGSIQHSTFNTHAPNSFFHVWMYSLHHSSLQIDPEQPHAFDTPQTILSYRAASSLPHASPSKLAMAVGDCKSRHAPSQAEQDDLLHCR